MIDGRGYSGVITYRTPDGDDGRETFSMTKSATHTVVQASCEIPKRKLIRHAGWSLDGAGKPSEGHVRVVLGGEVVGSSWFYFTGEQVECESSTTLRGRASQTLIGHYEYLGLHPLVGDGLIARARGCSVPGTVRIIPSVTCSYSPDGETDLVALPIEIGVEFVGEETIDVEAGRFEANRFSVSWRPEWPSADLWVLGDDAVFLKLQWPMTGATYELAHIDWTTAY